MKDKKTLLIIIAVLFSVIIVGGGVYGYQQVREKAFENGYISGQEDFYNQLIISLSQNQEILLPIQCISKTK